MPEDPSQSPYYEVHREQHAHVRDEDRKDGRPSAMPEELRGLEPEQLVARAEESR